MSHESTAGQQEKLIDFAVPFGDDVLVVAHGVDCSDGLTTEDQLLHLGRDLLGKALTPDYGWRADGRVQYIADTPDEVTGDAARLSTELSDQRWVPGPLEDDERHWIINDLDRPAVEVIPLKRFIADREQTGS